MFSSTGDSDTLRSGGSYKSINLFISEMVNMNLRLTTVYYLCKLSHLT